MAQKRKLEEVDDLDCLDKPVPSAILHGKLTSLSPIKKGRKSDYFDGRICDGRRKLRFVGFSEQQQKKMNDFFDNKDSIVLSDCEVKPSRQGVDMEVLLKRGTLIQKSPKKFDVTQESDAVVPLSNMDTAKMYEPMTVEVKVAKVLSPFAISPDLTKQDVIVADKSTTGKVTLWASDIGTLEIRKSYRLKHFTVREYNCQKYLSMPKDGGTIIPILDISEVNVQEVNVEVADIELNNGTIVGVQQLDSYKLCMKCKARVEPQTLPLGRCSRRGVKCSREWICVHSRNRQNFFSILLLASCL